MILMTKEEALQAMMDGEKITHRFFEIHEYLYMKGQDIFTEEGYNMGNVWDEFWTMRNEKYWKTGWEIYKN